MAKLCIVINTGDTVGNINSKVLNQPAGNPREGVSNAVNYLNYCISRGIDSSIQVTSRDTDPGITTHGTGSLQTSYLLGLPAGLPPVIPPGHFNITSAVSQDTKQVTLTWGASTGAVSYTVTYGTTSGSYPTTFSTSATSPTIVTGLTNDTTYYFMVTAVNTAGSTNANAEASATPGALLVGLYDPGLGITIGTGISMVANQVSGTQAWPLIGQPNPTLQPLSTIYSADGFTTQYPTFQFDGVDDKLQLIIPNTLINFTVLTYIFPLSVTSGRAIAGTRVVNQAPTLEFGSTNGHAHVLLSPAGAAAQNTSIISVNDGDGDQAGQVIAMSYNGTQLNTMVVSNGLQTIANVKLSAGDTFYIGGVPTHTSFSGYMAEVHIYNDALSLTKYLEFGQAIAAKYGG